MKKSFLIRYIAVSLCLLIAFSLPLNAFADHWEADDYSVTLFFDHEGEPIRNAHFRLYLIAENYEDAQARNFLGDFSKYNNVTVENPLETDGLMSLASTLSAYAARDGIVPDEQGDTDDKGTLKFKRLEGGVYLIDGGSTIQGDEVYNPQPFIAFLPAVIDEEECNRVNADVKYEFIANAYLVSLERSVVKVWDDGGENNPYRPKEIIAQLLMDGTIYEEVSLNAENNWRYSWKGLNPLHMWQVVEKIVPDDYSVSVVREGDTFILTNKYENEIPEGGWPTTEPDTTTPGGETTTSPDDKKPGSTLPNTGMLWWPVPVLVSSGFTLFGVGFIKRKRVEDEEEA